MARIPSKEYIEFARSYKSINLPPYYEQPAIPEIDEIEVVKTFKTNPFEPRNFNEFVGQIAAKEILKVIVDSANKEKRLIPSILLTGMYGHGKTTLAKLIARRHRKKIEIVDGSIAGIVITPSTEKVYIVDEAHNIPAQLADSYNILMDSGNLCIIACTTNPGALPAPFRSRFRTAYLETYTPNDITKIVRRAASRANINLTKASMSIIGERSKCNPRVALMLLDFIREISVLENKLVINTEATISALTKLGIDEKGLNALDRKYLDLLRYDKPMGLNYISSMLGLDIDTIQNEIEPYLIQASLVDRTQKGRLRSSDAFKKVLARAKELSGGF